LDLESLEEIVKSGKEFMVLRSEWWGLKSKINAE
jgi:hypothetical protein